MSSQIYSREYLQGIPEQRKQAIIDQFTASFRGELFNAAALGKTSYMYNRSTKHNSGITTYPPPPEITDAELDQRTFQTGTFLFLDPLGI
jgi:hypothetical protein